MVVPTGVSGEWDPYSPVCALGTSPKRGEQERTTNGRPYGGKTLRLGDKPPILFPL